MSSKGLPVVLSTTLALAGLAMTGCQGRAEPTRLGTRPKAQVIHPTESGPAKTNPAPTLDRAEVGAGKSSSGPLDALPTGAPAIDPSGPGVIEGSAVVTSVEAQASRTGLELLEAGGNAVDAAVGTALALAVTHPSAGNIGGGGFMLLRIGGELVALDFREDSPKSLDDAHFWKMIRSGGRGGRAVGVPGTVAGLHLAHSRYGKLDWKVVVEPAIQLAERGFVVGARQSRTIGWSRALLLADEPSRELFLPGGAVPMAGTRLRNEPLARTLKAIRDEGVRGFYEGAVARDIVASLGPEQPMSLEDLANYRAIERQPLFFDYRGVRIVTMPPPSGGGVAVAQNLVMLEALRAHAEPPGSARRAHLVIEASRRAQTERRLFVQAPEALSREALAARYARWTNPSTWLAEHPIDPAKKTDSRSLTSLYDDAVLEVEHTTHLSVVDREGGVVSCTLTLSGSFGAVVTTKNTGIVLNNAVASFSSVGDNLPARSKRTVSSMAPTLAFFGPSNVLVLGSPGGDTIPSTVTGVLLHLMDGLSLRAAVDAPRFHQGFVPDEVWTERERPLSPALSSALRALGHRLVARRSTIGDANVAAAWNGRALSVHDGREGGLAVALPLPKAPE